MCSHTETSSDESCLFVNSKKLYICKYIGCDATFSKPSKLKYHSRRHTGERPFACDEPNCKKTYLYQSHLRRHKKLSHEKITKKLLVCPYEGCCLELADKYSLKKHCNRKHNPERRYPYTCSECNQGFYKKRQLLEHSYVHTGVYPFECETCGLRFPTKRDCNRHKRTHTNYSCECGESFERWTVLLTHRRICSVIKLKCGICDKTFLRKSNLKTHMQKHTEDDLQDVYCCAYEGCLGVYRYKKNLLHHEKTKHLQIERTRLFCGYSSCGKSFTKKQSLKYHIQRFHSNIVKIKCVRKPRKDKGIPKCNMAAKLVGVKLPLNINRNCIDKQPILSLDLCNNVKYRDNSKVDENNLYMKNLLDICAKHMFHNTHLCNIEEMKKGLHASSSGKLQCQN